MSIFKIFKKPRNEPEMQIAADTRKPKLPEGELCVTCLGCKKTLFQSDLAENLYVCAKCGHHHRIPARVRVKALADADSFIELFGGLTSHNIIGFPGYDEKLKKAEQASGESEAVICGTAAVEGMPLALFVMDGDFMMGSMGTAVGEKITSLFEYATVRSLPVAGFTVSGGARMQEGILSLMQMAKTSGAVTRHGGAGNLYITLLTHPTTGGVTASFAMLGDIILAEPKALVGFAGPRVIEQTIRQKLPQGFQTAEFLLDKGFVDKIVPRSEQKAVIAALLKLHEKKNADAEGGA